METGAKFLLTAHQLYARKEEEPPAPDRPPALKVAGIALAVGSGVFIGTSFVLKKIGLLRANIKYNEEAGEGYGYLKNAFWWTGMTLMIIGEICNTVAYAFVDAILVTPLGALSVVITTILSAIFLKERLSFVGKIGCFLCIVGSIIILLSAPKESAVGTIQKMQEFMLSPGFLTYAGIVIVACAFTGFWVAPRYGKKSMMVYLSICSFIGGLSVVAIQGLGAAIVTQARGIKQYDQPFLWILLVFVIVTLVTEIIYLNVSVQDQSLGRTDRRVESSQPLQRGASHANILCYFYQRYHPHFSNSLQGVSCTGGRHHHHCTRILCHLLRCDSPAAFKVCQRCSRHRNLQG